MWVGKAGEESCVCMLEGEDLATLSPQDEAPRDSLPGAQ